EPATPLARSGPARWIGRAPDWWPDRSRDRAISRGVGWTLADESAWGRWRVTGFTAGWPAPTVRATWGCTCRRPPIPLDRLATPRTIGVEAPAWLGRSAFEAS